MMPKWFAVLTALGGLVLAAQSPLQQIRTVYLLPMGHGLDQYLANRLTAEGVFEVVTDPRRADALLTDQLGAGFERRFEELIPREIPPETPEAAEAKAARTDEQRKKDSDTELGDRLKQGSQTPISSFSRGKGNVFLVNIKTRGVVWSLYERPKKVQPDDLNRTSARIVQRLKKDMTGKP
jgi:hypothetical protein